MRHTLWLFFALWLFSGLPLHAGIGHLMPVPKQVERPAGGGGAPIRLTGTLTCRTKPSTHIEHAILNLLGQTLTVVDDAVPDLLITLTDDIGPYYDYDLKGYPCEAYRLTVASGLIRIEAPTETGVIRAIQTLAQLAEEDGRVEPCVITDWPAFKLRGWMHDVGRSFISVDELKRQIRLLGRFKVNTFHWHLTENQAWRFEVQRYPQLVAPESMTRFPGKYYTQQDCREIVRLAADYGITVIPEIDMPGHSQAFQRAMGHGMQTDEGVEELKNILTEVCEVFAESPYIHIGADEQRITYPDFLTILTDHLHGLGKRVVVWNPVSGLALTARTGADMTQMWSTAGKAVPGLPNIDCRYNYVNHFDVFADLVGIYLSNVYYAPQGSPSVAGEVTAVWNDRYLEREEDIVRQNNFYANVLAASERAWKGGGQCYIEQGGTVLPDSGEAFREFADWERRFLYHKSHALSGVPIPYVRQTQVRWQVTDPFPNGGDASLVFPPEIDGPRDKYDFEGQTFGTRFATGAALYLRHTWGTTVPAFYSNPALNATAYAWTYVYSPTAQEAGALIEFQNYGRSEHDRVPPARLWDFKGSRLWLNDEEIPAPAWENAGRQQVTNETPLRDENFAARPPVKIRLREGWNKVFLKLPYVATPNVRLNKWMFTFVITDPEGRDALEGLIYSPLQDSQISKSLNL